MTSRSSSERSEASQAFIFLRDIATKRRETADFEVPSPRAFARSPSGRRTARWYLRVNTFSTIRLSVHSSSRLPSRSACQLSKLGLYGDITCLDTNGNKIDPARGRLEDPVPETDDGVRKESLTSLRRYIAENTDGRIFIGGRRSSSAAGVKGFSVICRALWKKRSSPWRQASLSI